MSEIEINGFTYDTNVLESEQVARESRRTHREANAEYKSEADPRRKNALAYGNWMRGRSAARFQHYGIQQKQEIHEIAYISNWRLVCTCGLIADEPSGDLDQSEALWAAPGHIQVQTRSRVSVFVVKLWVSKAIGLRQHYWCENCGDIGAAIPTETGKVSLIGLKAIRKSHKCSGAK